MNGQNKSEVTKGVPGKQEQLWNLSQDTMQLIIVVLILKSAAAKCNAHFIHYLLLSYKP